MCSFHLEEVAPCGLMGMDGLMQCSPWYNKHAIGTPLLQCLQGTNTKMRNQELFIFMPHFLLASGIPFL